MSPATWHEIDEVVSEALALPPEARAAFLARRCQGRPDVEREAASLIENAGEAEGFLESPTAHHVAEGEAGEPAPIGLRAGPYRLESEIGRGGMSVVYLARRDDSQFEKRVAVKLLHLPGAPRPALRRFRAEQQILARLEHPNVARLLDAGVTGDDVPYIVMEFVEGVPITRWCEERKSGLHERIALFRQVCLAVQHAHRNLVVHRDLKPGNVLVTEEGGVKLLDFGIAALLPEPLAQGEATATVLRAMTPDYASPEQVRGEPASTACDIYSLGVLLFEMLAGRLPLALSGKPLSEMIDMAANQEPRRPSAVAEESNPGMARQLAGDLDSIILKAMRKAPAERYASAQELSDDLGRYLEGLPVQARKGTFRYLGRKLLARYKLSAAAALATAALLAGAGWIAFRQSREASEQRRLAAAQARIATLERGVADRERRVAERERQAAVSERSRRQDEVGRLARLLVFEMHDEIARLPGATPVRKKMIERSLAYLDALARETGDPASQRELAAAYARMAKVQGSPTRANLGDARGALASYGKARSILDELLRRNPGDRQARHQLASLLLELYELQPPAGGARTVEQAHQLALRLVAESPASEAALDRLAASHYALSRFRSGPTGKLQHLEEALRAYSRLAAMRPDDSNRQRNVALMHKYIAGLLVTGDPGRAFPHIESARRIDEARVAARPGDREAKLDLSFDLSMVAEYHIARHEWTPAAAAFESAARLRREVWRADPADTWARNRLAYILNRLGFARLEAGELEAAGAAFAEAIEHGRALQAATEDPLAAELLAWSHKGTADIASRQAGDDSTNRACAAYAEAVAWMSRAAPERRTPDGWTAVMEKSKACASRP